MIKDFFQLGRVHDELVRLRGEARSMEDLKARIGVLDRIKEVVGGLERTAEKHREDDEIRSGKREKPGYYRGYDPGKYDTAYYFVSKITEDDIIAKKEFSPELYGNCPNCGINLPVLMLYTQTFDSPEGDYWQKEAIVLCLGCEGIHTVKTVGSEYRFLRFD